MPAKNSPTGTAKDINLATLSRLFVSEDAAREFLEKKRWPNRPVCPHCQASEVYKLTARPGSKSPVRPGVYKCSKCREQFTVRVGTIFEDSKLPISKWLMAIHLMTSSKKGVSSHQIARECGITQKSAWFVNHRIREAMKLEPLAGMLQGVVEVDETYVGGKNRARGPVRTSALEHQAEIAVQSQRFNVLSSSWKKETKFISNVTTKAMHPAYQKIIGMGDIAVTLMLRDLQDNGPNDWFWALHCITDANPVSQEMAGNMVAMTEAWITWGKRMGYLPDYQRRKRIASQICIPVAIM